MVNGANNIVLAVRSLARKPGFTLLAAATLGLGIGATTAIFSLVENVLLNPLPFKNPNQLCTVWQQTATGQQLGISELDLDDYKPHV